MKSKKAEIFDSISAMAVGIGILTIMLIIAFMIMVQSKDVTVDLMTTNSVSNEEVTWTNETLVEFAVGAGKLELSCSLVVNGSGDADPVTI